jgi:TatD DNase family protein
MLNGEFPQQRLQSRHCARNQPTPQNSLPLRSTTLTAQLQHTAVLAQARTPHAAGLKHAPVLTGHRKSNLRRRKCGGGWLICLASLHMRSHPVGTAVEKRTGARLGYTTRHDQLDGTAGTDSHRHTPCALAVTHLRHGRLLHAAPQRQLRCLGLFVGYPHAPMITATTPELIDIGANLTHESFADDLPEVLRRAQHAGVWRMIVTGTSVAATRAAIALHAEHPTRLFATAGLHPHHATDLSAAALDGLRELARHPAVVAVGECGLDYYRNYSPHEDQLRTFRALLQIAVEVRKPVFLHQRDAHADFISILREFRSSLTDGVAHCFTGQANELDDYLDLNLAIGITGWICDERRGLHLLPMMQRIPADRLMIETDAPYLLPRTLRPKPASRRNEPAFLAEVASTIASARNETLDQLAASSTLAAEHFFRLPAR